MKKILSIAQYTFVQNIRNKVFYVMVLFGVVIVFASLLFSAIGGEQSRRVLLDLGLGAIEVFALLTVSFSAVTLILEEMEAKTIYLILSRPVSRAGYLVGRYLGLLAAVYCGMLVMSSFHVLILLWKGWAFSGRYLVALLFAAEKITVIGSLALFFSLFSTSAVSSISFTIFFWVLGHFSQEIRFLSDKVTGIFSKLLLECVYYLVPNMQYFNIRDFWSVPTVMGSWIPVSFVYGLLYSAFCIGLSLWLLNRKEF